MNIIRQITALILVLCVVGTLPLEAFAADVNSIPHNINTTIQQLKEQDPNVSIQYSDGTIHVFSSNSPQTSNYTTYNLPASSFYAPEGGSWRGFTPPSYVSAVNGDTIPYLIVYLPQEAASTLYISMTAPDIWDVVFSMPLASYGYNAIKDAIFNKIARSLTNSQIIFLYSSACWNLYNVTNEYSLSQAILGSSGGKVRIDFTTINGAPVNYYYTWTGDNVTNSPWQDFGPTFYRGEYWH